MERAFMKAFHVVGFFPTGSRAICNPPVMDTDEDWVLYTTNFKGLREELINLGYVETSKEGYQVADPPDIFAPFNRFSAFRGHDDENLIVVFTCEDFFRWKAATALAKRFNLTDKQDRIDLFRAIRSAGLVL